MKLHYKELGTGEPLLILHGLFGSSDNWRTLGKKFAEKFRVVFVDLPNHGRSPHTEDFNYTSMVEDLKELADDLKLDSFRIIGHSMGGKAAIAFAAKYPEKVRQMVVVDISHKQYEHHHDHILEGLHALNLTPLSSRAEAEKELTKYVGAFDVRQLLLKNLYWETPGKLGWRMNIPVISRELGRIIEEIPVVILQTETLFLRGGKSAYVPDTDLKEMKEKFPNSRIATISEAGHWIHSEAPEEFYSVVMDFFNEVS